MAHALECFCFFQPILKITYLHHAHPQFATSVLLTQAYQM
jgi:hypothetical protein